MPLEPRPGLRGVPWPERAAAAQVESPAGPLVLVSAYVPQARIVHHGGEAARKGAKHIAWFAASAWRFFTRHGWRADA